MRLDLPAHLMPLRESLKHSLLGHVGIVLFFLLASWFRFSFGEREAEITWVELPKGSSFDIGLGLKKSDTLPRTTIEEQKKIGPAVDAKNTKDIVGTAPDKNATGERAAQKKQAESIPIPSKKTTGSKPKASGESEQDRKMKEALAKINNQLSGRSATPEAAQVPANQDGYVYGTSDKPLKVLPSDPEYLKYQAMVRAKIIQEWIIPPVVSTSQLKCKLGVLMDDLGQVRQVEWLEKSGDESFDASAIRAVHRASPLPQPPERLKWEAFNEGFLIEFDPSLK